MNNTIYEVNNDSCFGIDVKETAKRAPIFRVTLPCKPLEFSMKIGNISCNQSDALLIGVNSAKDSQPDVNSISARIPTFTCSSTNPYICTISTDLSFVVDPDEEIEKFHIYGMKATEEISSLTFCNPDITYQCPRKIKIPWI